MKLIFKVAFLTSIVTATLVYVVLEWRPLLRPPIQTVDGQGGATGAISEPVRPDAALAAAAEPLEAQDLSGDERNNVDIYRRYSRGVVNITSTTLSYDFFLRPIPESGSGSGVVIDSEGHIVTNFHVIENARRLEVTLWDQSRHDARVVGFDTNNDLALLRIDAPGTEWVPVPLGTTDGLQVGQKVLAIGNPFGLEGTLTTGIISSLGRSIEVSNGQVIEGVIQTDAAINPGNSGGPLLNVRGEIIGINTAIVSPANAGSVGIGFAVPVETVRRVSQDLITYGRVRRVYMGFQGYDLAQMGRLADALDLGTDHGVLVTDISTGSPADRSGLRGSTRTVNVGNYRLRVGGDVIVSIEGRQVYSTVEIRTILDPYRPGDRIDVTVVRGGERVELQMTLEEQPSGQ